MLQVNAGTKEVMVIDVTDELANLSTLVGTSPTYDIVEEETQTNKVTDGSPDIDLPDNTMRLLCLIDTTVGTWPVGNYSLFAEFSNGAERPRLGPMRFKVV